MKEEDYIIKNKIHSQEEIEALKNNKSKLADGFIMVKIIGNCRFCKHLLKKIVTKNKSLKKEDLCSLCRSRWR